MSTTTVKYELYAYTPSKTLAIVAIICFASSTLVHLFQTLKLRTWYWIPFLLGGVFEILGYIGRWLSSKDKEAKGPFIMQSTLLLVAPALYAASIYMLLGRLTRLLRAEHLSIIRINWLTKIFVIGDILSFFMQGSGGGIMASGKANGMTLGRNIILGGLFVQVLFFVVFIIAMTVFMRRFKRSGLPAPPALQQTGMTRIAAGVTTRWRMLVIVIYVASLQILNRSMFRLVEYGQGHEGYLMKHEMFLYMGDTVMMLMAMLVFNLCHPGGVVSTKALENAAKDEGVMLEECTGQTSYGQTYGQA